MKILSISWLAGTLVLSPSPDASSSEVQEPAGEEREDDDDALLNEIVGAAVIYPQEMAELQFTLRPSYRDRRVDHLGSVNWAVEIGATDWWQFELAWDAPMIRGGQGVDTEAGFGDLELSTQFTWMNMGNSPLSAAIVLEVGFPTARPETEEVAAMMDPAVELDTGPSFGEGDFAYEPFVTLAVDFPHARGQFFTNLGAELSTEEQLPLVNVGVFVAASIVRPSLVYSWTLEQMSVTPGMSIVIGEFWEIDVGVPIGLNADTDLVGVDILFIYEFNPLELVRH